MDEKVEDNCKSATETNLDFFIENCQWKFLDKKE